jgi:hypothetical protein
VQILNEKYGISRDNISLIWGGGAKVASEKQKKKANLKANAEVMAALKSRGIDIEDLGFDDVDDFIPSMKPPEHLRLGIQSKVERQKEIDKFQSGKSLYCLYTFKSGGVGLSLHHTDEMTKVKCRRKKNGWVYIEDIPSIPTRQRVTFLSPTYSAIELVQGLGRAPRLTSFSDTSQTIIFYAGTIEARVKQIVDMKLRCLSKVVQTKESWSEVVAGLPETIKEDDDDSGEDEGGMFVESEDINE